MNTVTYHKTETMLSDDWHVGNDLRWRSDWLRTCVERSDMDTCVRFMPLGKERLDDSTVLNVTTVEPNNPARFGFRVTLKDGPKYDRRLVERAKVCVDRNVGLFASMFLNGDYVEIARLVKSECCY